MPKTDGCDLYPCHVEPVPGAVAIPFGFDLRFTVGFTRGGGGVVWSNVDAPALLSALIRDHATADDLADVARDLGLRILRRIAEESAPELTAD